MNTNKFFVFIGYLGIILILFIIFLFPTNAQDCSTVPPPPDCLPPVVSPYPVPDCSIVPPPAECLPPSLFSSWVYLPIVEK